MAAKKEAKDIQEQYDNYKDEMAELQETIELSALDKEMAEEKVSCVGYHSCQNISDRSVRVTIYNSYNKPIKIHVCAKRWFFPRNIISV